MFKNRQRRFKIRAVCDVRSSLVLRRSPHMAQRSYGKERRSPTAQPHWRRDVRREGIAPAQQQVEGRNQRHNSRYAIEDEK